MRELRGGETAPLAVTSRASHWLYVHPCRHAPESCLSVQHRRCQRSRRRMERSVRSGAGPIPMRSIYLSQPHRHGARWAARELAAAGDRCIARSHGEGAPSTHPARHVPLHQRDVVAADGRGVGSRRWLARGRHRHRSACTQAVQAPLRSGTCQPKSAKASSSSAVNCRRWPCASRDSLPMSSAAIMPTACRKWFISVSLVAFAPAARLGRDRCGLACSAGLDAHRPRLQPVATLRSGRTAEHEQATRSSTQSLIAWMIAWISAAP